MRNQQSISMDQKSITVFDYELKTCLVKKKVYGENRIFKDDWTEKHVGSCAVFFSLLLNSPDLGSFVNIAIQSYYLLYLTCVNKEYYIAGPFETLLIFLEYI